jgi:hypothetical protein
LKGYSAAEARGKAQYQRRRANTMTADAMMSQVSTTLLGYRFE